MTPQHDGRVRAAADRAAVSVHQCVRKGFYNIGDAVATAFSSPFRAAATVASAAGIMMALLLVANIGYAGQLLGRSVLWLPRILHDSFFYLYPSAMMRGMLIVYAVTAGITITTVATQLYAGRLSIRGASGTIPGLFAGGCAGCGAGLLTVVGATGVLTALPYGGRSLLVLGIVLMIYYLGRTGDPRVCTVE